MQPHLNQMFATDVGGKEVKLMHKKFGQWQPEHRIL